MVKMGADGNSNVLVHYGIIDAPMRPTSADTAVFIGDDLESANAVTGGYMTVLVKLNEAVTKGQKIAVQRNSFGDVVHEYLAPADGRVAIIGTDSATERGGTIVSLLVKRNGCTSGTCDYGGIEP
jgi:predicted deacylase